jgi:hypothetical protein
MDGFSHMITIRLTTWVNAPVERCFLLATSRGFYPSSRDGIAAGSESRRDSLQCGDTVEWMLGWREHTSRIDCIRPYSYFREVTTAGLFRHFEHDHHFAPMDDGTRVRDEIRFSLRMGPLGHVAGMTVVRALLMRMLVSKNTDLKRIAESSEWQKFVESDVITQERIPMPEGANRIGNMQSFA